MHARTHKINLAILKAKTRDKFRCRVCGRGREHGHSVIGSHCFPRNVQDPTDPNLIVTLCWGHDKEFDALHSLPDRADWLRAHRLADFANRMAEIDARCAA